MNNVINDFLFVSSNPFIVLDNFSIIQFFISKFDVMVFWMFRVEMDLFNKFRNTFKRRVLDKLTNDLISEVLNIFITE